MTGAINRVNIAIPTGTTNMKSLTPLATGLVKAGGSATKYDANASAGGENVLVARKKNDVNLQHVAQAAQAAAAPALSALEATVSHLQSGQFEEGKSPNNARLIDKAEVTALDAISHKAGEPNDFYRIMADGSEAAKLEVTDLALALSMLKRYDEADVSEDYNKLTEELCDLVLSDKLGVSSGFSHWEPNNSYKKVQLFRDKITKKLNLLERGSKSDLFTSVFNGEVMPAICYQLENKFGALSLATWEKVNCAKGTISEAAANAAHRELLSYKSTNGKETKFHSLMNQARVAYHWAELTRPVTEMPAKARAGKPAKHIPTVPIIPSTPNFLPADSTTAGTVTVPGSGTTIHFEPKISLNVNGKQRDLVASIKPVSIKNDETPLFSGPIRTPPLQSQVEYYDKDFTEKENHPERYDTETKHLSFELELPKSSQKTVKKELDGKRAKFKLRGTYIDLQARNSQLSSTERPMLVGPGMGRIKNGIREN